MDDTSYHGGVHGAREMYQNETAYSALLQWRLSYQAHRAGAAAGAKGEAGALGLSVKDVRQLPVAELAAHLHHLKLRAVAVSPAYDGEEKPIHVHVGAGRLGLGLVVPALVRASRENGGTLVLLQRPSDAWSALAHGKVVRMTVRKECVCTLRVVRAGVAQALADVAAHREACGSRGRMALADLGTQRADTVPAVGAAAGERAAADGDDQQLIGLLVLTESAAELDVLARRTTSLSCSLGPALESGMAPLLAALARAPSKIATSGLRLYAGENDHDAVARFAATAPVVSLGLRVAPLLVDRVCTDRIISAEGVETAAEPWCGEIVVMPTVATAPGGEKKQAGAAEDEAADGTAADAARRRLMAVPPFSGEGVRWPSSAAEAHFLHRRKILTVNGTHTTLAFLTLSLHEPPPKVGLPTGDYELLRAVQAEDGAAAGGRAGGTGTTGGGESGDNDDDDDLQVEETYRQTWCWAVARQLLLLFECSEEVAIAALQCQRESEAETQKALADALLGGARVAIQRLGKGGDTTRRILGGGVVNRFQTRLQPVAAFLAPAAPKGAAPAGAAPAPPSAGSGGGMGSKWIRGALPKLLMRRARLTETAMRLAVLGLATDAERFTVSTSVPGSRHSSPSKRAPQSPAKIKREMPAVPRAPAPSPKAPAPSPKSAPAEGPVALS